MSKLDKEAETIQRLIDEGKLLESELPLLVREGLSQETVDHWKKYRLQKEDKMTSDVSQLIDKLTNAVSFKFKDDATSPNLTISKLRTGYYCSVVRYSKQGAAQKKVVVCKATAANLEDAVKSVVTAFLKVAVPTPDPLQELDKLANG